MLIDDIISEEIQTIEDEISGDFCGCGHKITEEHYEGEITGVVKCYALTYNGAVYSNCRCESVRVTPFEIKVTVYATNPQNNNS